MTLNKHARYFLYKVIVLTSVFAAFIFSNANATVYKCEKKEGVEFSEFPCAKNAKKMEIKEQNPIVNSAPVNQNSKRVVAVDNYIRSKQINQTIAQHKDKIDSLTKQMNSKLDTLKNQSDAQVNNLTGTKKSTAIAEQSIDVSNHFNSLIEDEQREIDRLKKEKLALQSASKNSVYSAQKEQINQIDEFIKQQAIEREISSRESKINTYKRQMERQISALETQANNQPNRLKDASFAEAQSKKIAAMRAKYDTLIDIELRQIDRLHKEMARLKIKCLV